MVSITLLDHQRPFPRPRRVDRLTWTMFALPLALHQCSTGHATPSNATSRLQAPAAYFATVGPTSMLDGFSGTNKNSAMLEPGYWRPSSGNASWTRACKAISAIDKASSTVDNIRIGRMCDWVGSARWRIFRSRWILGKGRLSTCLREKVVTMFGWNGGLVRNAKDGTGAVALWGLLRHPGGGGQRRMQQECT